MNLRKGKGKYATRKAISPIIATVLIIAITLIAAVAIGGFVFGIFGSSSNAAEVSVTNTALAAAGTSFISSSTPVTTFTCDTAAASGVTITLTNSGTASATVTGVVITWAGATNSFTPTTSGATNPTCAVGAAGSPTATTYVVFTTGSTLTIAAVSGQTFSGAVTLSNGAKILFTGTWE